LLQSLTTSLQLQDEELGQVLQQLHLQTSTLIQALAQATRETAPPEQGSLRVATNILTQAKSWAELGLRDRTTFRRIGRTGFILQRNGAPLPGPISLTPKPTAPYPTLESPSWTQPAQEHGPRMTRTPECPPTVQTASPPRGSITSNPASTPQPVQKKTTYLPHPTHTPKPTLTPRPTHTALPSQTSKPTHTPRPTHTPKPGQGSGP
jgi:hypothetical protein